MPAKNLEAIQRLPHVAVVSAVIQKLSTAGKIEVLYGIDYPSFNALKPFVYVSGGPFQGPYDVIVDDVFASSDGGHKVGDTISIMDHPFASRASWNTARRAQAAAHRYHGPVDGRRRQGVALLHQMRRSGQ